jgi:molybdopterin converting factor small subunit
MKLRIQYFANLRDKSGKEEEVMETPTSCPLELYRELQKSYGFELNTDQLGVAINDRFANWEQPFEENDLVTFIPPVGGG